MAPTWLATSPDGSDEREIRDDYESDSDEERQQHSPTSPNNEASSITLLEGEALVSCDEVIRSILPSLPFPALSPVPLFSTTCKTKP